MTFEEKRRAAFEEWFKREHKLDDRLLKMGEQHTGDERTAWKAWQAALEWVNKGERE